jgi:uncharacterized membrane protein YdjX (TVP38/TMEM64 family)
MNRFKVEKRAIVKLLFLVLIFTCIVIAGIRIAPWLIEHGRNPEYIRNYLNGFGKAGFLVFVLMHAVQVIIVIIPGDLFSICGGFVYGIPLGFALSFLGMMLGTVIVFYISRFFGADFISNFIAKDKIEKLSGILNSTNGTIGMFLVCSIPFIPKDVLMYAAGLTPVKASRLFLIYGLSRIPGMLIWVSIGSNTFEKNMWGLGTTISILLVVLILFFFIGRFIVKKKRFSISKIKWHIKRYNSLKNK